VETSAIEISKNMWYTGEIETPIIIIIIIIIIIYNL